MSFDVKAGKQLHSAAEAALDRLAQEECCCGGCGDQRYTTKALTLRAALACLKDAIQACQKHDADTKHVWVRLNECERERNDARYQVSRLEDGLRDLKQERAE